MVTRRTLLKASVAGGLATAFTGVLGGLNAHASNALRVRKTLENMPLDSDDLSTYRDFVGIMQSNDQSKPVSWLQYSLMHGEYGGDYRYCPHGDWYFLPWHREFTLMYERAAQQLTGNPDFAMPYWNWTNQRYMPEAFTNPTYKGKPNPLYVANRKILGSSVLTDKLVGPELFTLPGDPAYSDESVYSETNFEQFGTTRNPQQIDLDMKWVVAGGGYQGKLEGSPHNNVHNDIGVFMPSAGSPRDPIFFMHHSHIDGIWARWNELGRVNSSSNLWLDMNFKDNFLDPGGNLYSSVVKDLQSTNEFGYTYDNLPGAVPLIANLDRDTKLEALVSGASAAESPGLVNRIPSSTLAMGSAGLHSNAEFAAAVEQVDPEQGDVFALIQGIMLGDNVRAMRVFVNNPDLKTHSSETDPSFVTSAAFLKHGPDEGKEMPSIMVNLSPVLRKLAEQGLLTSDQISVQLQPVPEPGVSLSEVGSVQAMSVEIVQI